MSEVCGRCYVRPAIKPDQLICVGCLWVVQWKHLGEKLARILSADSTSLMPCGVDGCDAKVCVVCLGHDCKWPGRCWNRCAECGGPSVPSVLLGEYHPALYCSKECGDISWARAEAEGRVFKIGDMTPEQTNEMLNKIGLGLAGVGPRQPS